MILYIKTEEAYTWAVEKFSDMVFRIAYQQLFHTHDAQDVVQDVFLKLLRHQNKCFQDEEHLKAWLIRVTVNQCLDCKKALVRRLTVPVERMEYPSDPQKQELLEELYELPADYRIVLYLYYYEQYTIKEIAQILGKKQNTVNSRLTRGRKRLKKQMEEKNERFIQTYI
ncbi:MAG: RNA polymerase sigma factor [Eubacterium sp.]|nr:RNA polymerase sigma factor [Eubacterium sp.]